MVKAPVPLLRGSSCGRDALALYSWWGSRLSLTLPWCSEFTQPRCHNNKYLCGVWAWLLLWDLWNAGQLCTDVLVSPFQQARSMAAYMQGTTVRQCVCVILKEVAFCVIECVLVCYCVCLCVTLISFVCVLVACAYVYVCTVFSVRGNFINTAILYFSLCRHSSTP